MITVSFSLFLAIYLSLGVGIPLLLLVSYDRWSCRQWKYLRRKRTYCCVRCNQLFALPVAETKAQCPRCNLENAPLKI